MMKMFSGIQNIFYKGVIGTILSLVVLPFGLVKNSTPANATIEPTGLEDSNQVENIDSEAIEPTLLSGNNEDSSFFGINGQDNPIGDDLEDDIEDEYIEDEDMDDEDMDDEDMDDEDMDDEDMDDEDMDDEDMDDEDMDDEDMDDEDEE